jgi:phage repressor protein C with HTH and peptisase S24 domain
MNRRKKIKDIYDKRMKQANLKVNPKKAKPKYISKAERAKMEAEAAANPSTEIEATDKSTETDA